MKNLFSSLLILIFVLLAAAACPAYQQLPASWSAPANLPGKWLNEGEHTTLLIKDNLTCVLKYTDFEEGSEVGKAVEIKGRAKIKGNHITINWGKGYWHGSQTEYEYRNTGKQLVLWIIRDNQKSPRLAKGGQFGFYKDEPYAPKIKRAKFDTMLTGKWINQQDQVALFIRNDLSCVVKFESGENGETIELKGKVKMAGDRVTIKWEKSWRYGSENTYQYRVKGSQKALWLLSSNDKTILLPKGGQLGFERDENR